MSSWMPFTYELHTIKPKGGFYRHEVFNSTYQVLTKFHKVCVKSLFCFWKKGSVQKKTFVIDVLIFNKLDCQNCHLTFLTFKLYTHIKSLPKLQFWNCTIPRKLSPLLETKCPVWFPVFKLFAESLNRCKSCIRAVWLFFSENRKWIFYET